MRGAADQSSSVVASGARLSRAGVADLESQRRTPTGHEHQQDRDDRCLARAGRRWIVVVGGAVNGKCVPAGRLQ